MIMRMRLCAQVWLFLVSGCAIHTNPPATVRNPRSLAAAQGQAIQERSLDDPALKAWMKDAAGFEPPTWPLKTWDFDALTLAAYYFNPDMDVARANAEVAQAAIKTAAMKPNPSVGASAGYETAAESPYLFGFDFSVPIETAGKRGYRIAEATHLSEASRLQLAQTAWEVRSRLRAALADLIVNNQAGAALREQELLQHQYADLLEARFRAGEIPLPEATAAQIDLTNLRLAQRAAEGQAQASRAALAAAIGIPLSGLAEKEVAWTGVNEPPRLSQLPAQDVQVAAVENRLDVQRMLAQYEATQSRLQLEIARKYPDIVIGPGYAFEEGAHLISLQLGTTLPIRNRNEGPIAEAEAQRKAAGVQLLATQTAVIAQTDKALAQYGAAYAVLEEARRAKAQVESQNRTAHEWQKSGESDQLVTLSADLQLAVAERARLDALHQAQLALGLLEDAVQRPIDPGTMPVLPNKAPR